MVPQREQGISQGKQGKDGNRKERHFGLQFLIQRSLLLNLLASKVGFVSCPGSILPLLKGCLSPLVEASSLNILVYNAPVVCRSDAVPLPACTVQLETVKVVHFLPLKKTRKYIIHSTMSLTTLQCHKNDSKRNSTLTASWTRLHQMLSFHFFSTSPAIHALRTTLVLAEWANGMLNLVRWMSFILICWRDTPVSGPSTRTCKIYDHDELVSNCLLEC